MNLIVVHRAHTLGVEEARRRLSDAAHRYGDRFGIHGVWDGNELLVARAGARARARIFEDSVVVELELGRLFRHWQQRAQATLERILAELLA